MGPGRKLEIRAASHCRAVGKERDRLDPAGNENVIGPARQGDEDQAKGKGSHLVAPKAEGPGEDCGTGRGGRKRNAGIGKAPPARQTGIPAAWCARPETGPVTGDTERCP
ncbi:peptidase family M28 [Rhodovulum sulfidophilum]|uniref:Peptidase family M28 n=1 Tax=Rhodovulum sulfidophilum TaxID=35806 RepID=A0A0D6B868_RHOSU|nr:peptidase family M28 [Rhodovulum sulfidophilum]